MKDKTVGRSVRIQKGSSGDVALEYVHRRSGASELVGIRQLPPPTKEDFSDLLSLKALDLVAFNEEAERAFVDLLAQMCDAAGSMGVSVRVARAEVAFRLRISVETAKRYIEKWCVAPSAPFEIVNGCIFKKKKEEQEND